MWLLLLGAGAPSHMELTGEEGIKGTRAEGRLGLAASGFGSSPQLAWYLLGNNLFLVQSVVVTSSVSTGS